jgi:hypothetical protein
MSTISSPSSWSLLRGLLDGLSDPLDASQPGVPLLGEACKLRNRATEPRLIEVVAPFSADARTADEAGSVQDRKVLGNRLSRDWQLIAERRGSAWAPDQKQVEHAPPGGVSDR